MCMLCQLDAWSAQEAATRTNHVVPTLRAHTGPIASANHQGCVATTMCGGREEQMCHHHHHHTWRRGCANAFAVATMQVGGDAPPPLIEEGMHRRPTGAFAWRGS